MSGNDPDLAAPSDALAAIAKGLDLAHSELKDLGLIGQASMGRGFSDLALSGVELGHGGLTEAFTTFCDRWEWGVRSLTLRGNQFAQDVGLSAGSFAEQERYIKDTIKIGVNSVNGNPHLSEDEVKEMRWETVRDQHTWDGAGLDARDLLEARNEVEQTWNNTGYDVADSALDAMESSGQISPEERRLMDERLREEFRPDQETVEQAEQPRWGENG
ncbi:hypothetical protein [Streptomyces sp. NPDC056144]|uniref:hypothetical protein n=1 Tax=unclassified Streptomyces TaxID=2593676 RepID=UPI0035DA4089